jgi:hypothetical protein
VAGRHRGPIAPGPEFGDDASATSAHAFVLDEFQGEPAQAADKGSAGRRPARGMILIVVSVAIAVVGIAAAALVLSGRGVRHHDAPQALAQTTAEAMPAKPTPEELPTTGMFVPPRQPATPVVRKSTPAKKMPSHPPSQAKPPCPFQVPFARDWCNAHGYAPPTG